ncbi:UDP-glucosyltransferase 2-like [Metopolophium dirhodum]|uniref:UDP-glucosyltransferase 2-like n=1 Tax=Metopolophium dirhodum TaxID=44670 RepID=UPI00298F4624|nr:UDP-glucosyltransferase 2-like [Metopolophium dirhodum]XP_060878991.1 UDP-glucosyltransferase 2-like [Metopolophium dirhodum]
MSSCAVLQLIAFCACPALILQQWTPAGAANILAVQPSPGRSHWNMMRAVLRALTDHGHTVTVFTPFVDGDRDGYTEVDVSGPMKARVGLNATFLFETFGTTRKLMTNMMRATRSGCDTIYEQRRMVDILDGAAKRRFDLVVTEPLVSECVAYVATALNVPVLYVVPPPIVTYLERSLTGHVPNPAAGGHLLSRRGVPKTFAERLANAALTVYCSTLTWYAEWQLRWADPRPYDAVDLVRPSLIFSNTHFITEPARPLSPDVVQIGGIHLTTPKRLPNDILEFIDDAPQGVIYFTFGSVVSIASLPENVLSSLREALAQVPQKVLWKYEGEMEDKQFIELHDRHVTIII